VPEHLDPVMPTRAGQKPATPVVARSMHPANWAILVLPFGIAVGYLQVAMPYVLRLRGVDMAVIGAIAAAANTPHAVKFFWAPVLDAGWARKKWFFLTVALTALSLFLAALITPDNRQHLGPFGMLTVYTAVLTIAQVMAATSSSAVLGIMATVVPENEKGRASGWQTAGNLAGTAIGGAGITWLLGHTTPRFTGSILAAICMACTLPVLLIHEPVAPKHPLGALMLVLVKDVWATLRSRSGWTGMLICLSPVGAGAMVNLFSALALDYSSDPKVRENMVLYATGILGGLVSAAGALVGGYLADRMNRRVAYVLFGLVTSMCAVAMILAPANPTAFTIGCLAYSFATGLCYSAFYAFVFEMVGKGQGATTKLALFISASNQAINYVTWLDGKAYDVGKGWWRTHAWGGRVGMLGMDALSTFVGIGVLGAMMMLVKRLGVEKGAQTEEGAAPASG
jgi:PAT family beta-lactamase induction signal transducer AmpG